MYMYSTKKVILKNIMQRDQTENYRVHYIYEFYVYNKYLGFATYCWLNNLLSFSLGYFCTFLPRILTFQKLFLLESSGTS